MSTENAKFELDPNRTYSLAECWEYAVSRSVGHAIGKPNIDSYGIMDAGSDGFASRAATKLTQHEFALSIFDSLIKAGYAEEIPNKYEPADVEYIDFNDLSR